MREHGKHCVSSTKARHTVATLRRRLVLERHLPPGVEPTPENLLRYYGELPPALPGPVVTYNINACDAAVADKMVRAQSLRKQFQNMPWF